MGSAIGLLFGAVAYLAYYPLPVGSTSDCAYSLDRFVADPSNKKADPGTASSPSGPSMSSSSRGGGGGGGASETDALMGSAGENA